MRCPAGTIRHCVALTVLTCIGGTGALADQQHPYRRTATVCIQLKIKDEVPGPMFRRLRDEATRIWLRHGIALIWTQPAAVDCDTLVSMSFDDAQVREIVGRKRTDAMAVTVFSGHARIIHVSAPRAYAMLEGTRELSATIMNGAGGDFRKGILLGRVVAHELGHALLQTTSHSDTGLMRAVFGANDALSDADGVTDLTAADQMRLATRFSSMAAGPDGAVAVVAGP
jgi:hypothetical protein